MEALLSYEHTACLISLAGAIGLVIWQFIRTRRGRRRLQSADSALRQKEEQLAESVRELQDIKGRLVQLEKLSTIGTLASGVIHKMNTPLQTILTSAQRIGRYPDDVARHRQSAALIEQAAQHCHSTVQGLLAYTRQSRSSAEPVDLNQVIDSALLLLRAHLEQADIALEVEQGTVSPVTGDFDELCTVVTNLTMNACDAVLTPPRIKGSTPSIQIATSLAAGQVRLSVKDNGPGVSTRLRERIFAPFFTTKETGAGTGLGLFISREIVERHGGRIELESEEIQGALFAVYLPVGEEVG